MQSTVVTGLGTTVRQVRLHHAMTVGGLALAIAIAVGLGALKSERQPVTTSVPPSSAPIEVREATPGRVLVYLVGSEAEQRALEQSLTSSSEWFVETYAGMDTRVRVMVLDQEMEESLDTLARLIPEASITAGLGPAIKLVDMR